MQGHPEIARAKLTEALRLDPHNIEVTQHIDDLATLAAPDSLAEDAALDFAPPLTLEPLPGLRSFHLKGTAQSILKQVLGAYGIAADIDDTVPTRTIRFDVDNVDFKDVVRLLSMATESFIVPLDSKTALVARDTRANHTEFDRLAMSTLRLPGLDSTTMNDMGNIARNLFSIQKASLQQQGGTLTVRAPAEQVEALDRTFADLLQGRSEVMLDVRMFQLARSKTRNLGLQLPQTFTLFNVPSEVNSIIQQNQSLVQEIVSSGLANAGDYAAIAAILIASGEVTNSVLGQPFALFGGGLTESGITVPGVTANLALNSSDTRALDHIQLRLEDHEKGTIRSGVRYPIQTSNYSSIAASSINIPGVTSAGLSSSLSGFGVSASNLNSLQTVPQVQYQDLGLTMEVTPAIQSSKNVALNFQLKMTGLQGSTLNGMPVLTNQSYSANIVVPQGRSAMLVSNMSRQESNAVDGVPGLSELPGFQSTTNSQREVDVSSLVIVITPHLLRRRTLERAGPLIPLPGMSSLPR
jgi:hypothetical protein